jgi:hypothetical protein
MRGCWQKFGESEETVKKIYGANLTIYRGEGVVSRNYLGMTAARNPEDAYQP